MLRSSILTLLFLSLIKRHNVMSHWPLFSSIIVSTLILTISHSEIKGKNTDNITQWDQRKTYWQYHTVRSKEKILTISHEIKHWYWQYHTVRSKEKILTISHNEIKCWYWQYHSEIKGKNTDNITVRSKEKILTISHSEIKCWYWQQCLKWTVAKCD
jgi:hypothetical protein